MKYIKFPLPYLLGWFMLMAFTGFSAISAVNGALQLTLFALVVCLPLWKTGRMSYVDIGWPWGLVILGVVTYVMGEGHPWRVAAVSIVYLVIGGRMGVGALVLWKQGHLKQELPRYQYQRLRWKEQGIGNEKLIAQIEVLSQGLANTSFLALPAFVIAANPTAALSLWEVLGFLVWLGGYVIESIADSHKLLFIHKSRQAGLKNQVCDVGLWKYSRHPNYFGEWMVWNGLIIASIPSWLHLYTVVEPLVVWAGLGLGTLYIARIMYWVLNTYSGGLPAEHYSRQKRPGYAEYQRTTNMFFPGPRKSPASENEKAQASREPA